MGIAYGARFFFESDQLPCFPTATLWSRQRHGHAPSGQANHRFLVASLAGKAHCHLFAPSNLLLSAPRCKLSFFGHAGWGTDDVQKTRLDPSAMVAAGTKKSEEASRAAPLTERPDPNKSSVTGGIFGPGANPGTITSQTKVDRNRSSIQGGIFG